MPKSPNQFVSFSWVDRSNEPASTKVTLKEPLADFTALTTAINNMSTLLPAFMTQGVETVVNALRPGTGQREERYLVRLHDTVTGDKFTLSVPGVRAGTVYQPNSDMVDLVADAQAAALKTQLETFATSPWSNNAILVDSIEATRGSK